MKTVIFLAFSLIFFFHSAMANVIVKEGVYVFDPKKEHLLFFSTLTNLVIDHVDERGYELYGPEGLTEWIRDLKISFVDIQETFDKDVGVNDYPTPIQIEDNLKDLVDRYPNILHLFSVGKSVEGRELWFVKISDNPQEDEVEPEVKYIANMHGDEIVGRELMVKLIEELVQQYGKDQTITDLIENTEIFIMPSMNPDGSAKRRRGNAKWVDLNRNFPDFSTGDNQNEPNGRALETQAIMRFQKERHFALSANFHGGAVVVNYPWDTVSTPPPLENLIITLSKEYASTVPGMFDSTRFPDGITNGYDWYEINGGMQDWSYYWHGDLQVTIELSRSKWPRYSTIEKYYNDNKASLIRYLSRIHQGAGFVFSDDIKGEVTISKIEGSKEQEIGTFSFNRGEYYKVLESGQYNFQVNTEKDERRFTIKVQPSRFYINGNYMVL